MESPDVMDHGMNISDEKALIRTAYHEASHIVVAFFLELQVLRCGIRLNGQADGIAYLEGAAYDETVPEGKRDAVVIALLAGAVGQLRFDPTTPPNADGDQYRVRQILGLDSEVELTPLMQPLRGEAERLLDRYWECVKRVAEALLSQSWTSTRGNIRCKWTLWPNERFIDGDSVSKLLQECA